MKHNRCIQALPGDLEAPCQSEASAVSERIRTRLEDTRDCFKTLHTENSDALTIIDMLYPPNDRKVDQYSGSGIPSLTYTDDMDPRPWFRSGEPLIPLSCLDATPEILMKSRVAKRLERYTRFYLYLRHCLECASFCAHCH
jgi:hypothetical protein